MRKVQTPPGPLPTETLGQRQSSSRVGRRGVPAGAVRTAAAHINVAAGLVAGIVFAVFVVPLFPDETPSLIVTITPGFIDGQFKVAGGIAVVIAVWLLYSCLFLLFQKLSYAVTKDLAKAHIASLSQ